MKRIKKTLLTFEGVVKIAVIDGFNWYLEYISTAGTTYSYIQREQNYYHEVKVYWMWKASVDSSTAIFSSECCYV